MDYNVKRTNGRVTSGKMSARMRGTSPRSALCQWKGHVVHTDSESTCITVGTDQKEAQREGGVDGFAFDFSSSHVFTWATDHYNNTSTSGKRYVGAVFVLLSSCVLHLGTCFRRRRPCGPDRVCCGPLQQSYLHGQRFQRLLEFKHHGEYTGR